MTTYKTTKTLVAAAKRTARKLESGVDAHDMVKMTPAIRSIVRQLNDVIKLQHGTREELDRAEEAWEEILYQYYQVNH